MLMDVKIDFNGAFLAGVFTQMSFKLIYWHTVFNQFDMACEQKQNVSARKKNGRTLRRRRNRRERERVRGRRRTETTCHYLIRFQQTQSIDVISAAAAKFVHLTLNLIKRYFFCQNTNTNTHTHTRSLPVSIKIFRRASNSVLTVPIHSLCVLSSRHQQQCISSDSNSATDQMNQNQ